MNQHADEERMATRNGAVRWAGASFLLTLVASLVLLLAPLGSEFGMTAVSPTGPSPSPQAVTVTHPNLLHTEGWSVAVPLSVPVLLTGFGVLAAGRGWRPALVAVSALLGVGIVLGALSIGVYYLPTEAAMIVATVKVSRT